MEKPRLLIVIPNLGRGGAQQVFRQQVQSLNLMFDVTGCVFNWDGAFDEDHQLNIVSLDVPAGDSYISKARNFLLRVSRLRALKRERKIQLTISHLEGADYVSILAATGDQTVCWIHGTKRHDDNISGLLGVVRKRLLLPFLYARATKLVAVSQGIADELGGVNPAIKRRLCVIYNGFDTETIAQLGTEPLHPTIDFLYKSSKIIITHCRLSKQKNLPALLTIFSTLQDHPYKLVVIGDGELRKELIQLSETLNLKTILAENGVIENPTADVFFLGQQKNPFKFLKAAHLYVMTSNWEGFPLALCEAMACGLPVLAADCFTGPREILGVANMPQPVMQSVRTEHGVLMPLVSASNMRTVKLWADEVRASLEATTETERAYVSINRIKKFSLSESMGQTINLVRELL
jgi:glycosyltransferase involved in cell wall biosynthesis